jgi:hypothetical protein
MAGINVYPPDYDFFLNFLNFFDPHQFLRKIHEHETISFLSSIIILCLNDQNLRSSKLSKERA